jgi:hypothetical protein
MTSEAKMKGVENNGPQAQVMASLSAQSRSALTLFASPLVARSGAHRKFL